MDLGEQPADAVGHPGGLAGQVVVEADEDFEFSEGFIADVDAAQRVRQRPGGVGDDVGVAGAGRLRSACSLPPVWLAH